MNKNKNDKEKSLNPEATGHHHGEQEPKHMHDHDHAKPAEEKKPEEKKDVTISAEEFQKLQDKAKLADENYDKLLRSMADFDNYRKRMAKEKADLLKYANTEFIFGLLPIMDNFDRATVNIKDAADINKVKEGIEMIVKQFHKYLEEMGLTRIPAVGEVFDPHKHEAVMHVESDSHPENIVTEELQKGFMLGDRVIKPSMVKVSKGKNRPQTPSH